MLVRKKKKMREFLKNKEEVGLVREKQIKVGQFSLQQEQQKKFFCG